MSCTHIKQYNLSEAVNEYLACAFYINEMKRMSEISRSAEMARYSIFILT